MKKCILALAVMSIMTTTSNAMYLVGNPAGEWGCDKGIEMTETSEGWEWTGRIEDNEFFCFATNLAEDWDTFNSLYRLGPEEQNTQAVIGEYELVLGVDRSFKGNGEICTYTVIKEGDSYRLTVTAVPNLIYSMGVLGNFNTWDNDIEMTKLAEDVWTATLSELEGEFKFRANKGWDINFGGEYNPTYISEDCNLPVFHNGGNFCVESVKNITFILDVSNNDLITKLNSNKASALALRGAMNGWEWQPSYCLYETSEQGVYSIFLPSIEAGSEFKISNEGWDWQFSSNNLYMIAGEEYNLDLNGVNMAFDQRYTNITLILDTNKNTLKAYVDDGDVEDLPDGPMYVIGEPAGIWSPSVGLEMEKVSGGWKWTGNVGRNSYFAFATQLEDPESQDWDHFNSTYRLNPKANETYAIPGEFELYRNGLSVAFRGCDTKCTYFIKKEGDNYTLTVRALDKVPSDLLIETMGVIGGFNNWAGDVEMEEIAENVWIATMSELDGDFKFRANGGWDINYGNSIIGEILLDGSIPISENSGNIYANYLKNVTLILDIPNMTLYTKSNGARPTPYAVCGKMNDWTWQLSDCLYETDNAGVYIITLPYIEAGVEFRISNQDWTQQFTTANTNMIANREYPLEPIFISSSMAFEESYSNMTLILDTNRNTLRSSAEGDINVINEISLNDKDTLYYNLQGTKVEKDAKGILIRVSKGKAEKVIVK